jgi:hypothetical protein
MAMNRRVRMASRLIGAGAVVAAVAAGFAPAAHADSGSSNTNVVGESVTSQAIGAQFAFNIPGLIPLPNENIIEEDAPFARSIVSTGPTVQSIGAAYYPGDILANLGGLESEFFPPAFPNTPYPLMAEAEYPNTAQYQSTGSFGGPAPGGSSPVSALSGTAHATSSGGDANGTLTDLTVGAGMGQNGAALLEAASEQSNEVVNIGTSSVTATASSVVKSIEIAGMVDISQLTSTAQSTSDGNSGTPKATVTLGQVTVDGQPSYIDNQGIHVVGTNPAPAGTPTAAQIQNSLNQTLSQDGITVELVTPQETTNGAEGIANSGGLLISISHGFSVPFINTGQLTNNTCVPVPNVGNVCGQPCIPTQDLTGAIGQGGGLGSVCLPAGNYTAVTSITLGLASTDVNASVIAPLSVPSTVGLGSTGLGSTGLGSLSSLGSTESLGSVSGPGTSGTGPTHFGGGLLKFPIRGVPAPLGWVVLGLILCVIFAYPMMLTARWQFLVGRR